MQTLTQIQHAFKNALIQDDGPWDTKAIGVVDQPPVPLEKRIRIYHYAYSARIAESLKEDFALLLNWIEEESFDTLVRAYLMEYPSTYRTLAEVSRHFPEFLDRILQPGDPKFLPDLARYEWARTVAVSVSNARPDAVFELTRIGEFALDEVVLVLNPTLHLMNSEWPVDRLKTATSVAFRECVRLAIYRGGEGVSCDRLRQRQWEMLARIEAGEPLSSLLEWMRERRISAAQTQRWFTTWAARRLIQGFRHQK